MTERTFCSTCGTPFDGTRQFCERCGVFLGDPSWAPRDARACTRCGAVNAKERTECGRCRTSLVTGFGSNWEGHVLAEPGPEVPRFSGQLTEGDCSTCATVNPPDQTFCGSCGRFLEGEGAIVTNAAQND